MTRPIAALWRKLLSLPLLFTCWRDQQGLRVLVECVGSPFSAGSMARNGKLVTEQHLNPLWMIDKWVSVALEQIYYCVATAFEIINRVLQMPREKIREKSHERRASPEPSIIARRNQSEIISELKVWLLDVIVLAIATIRRPLIAGIGVGDRGRVFIFGVLISDPRALRST